MTLKSILDVDVQDGKFQRFLDLYGKYQAALAKAPAQWRAVNVEQAKSLKAFDRLAALMLTQNRVLEETNRAEKDRTGNVQRTERLWVSMAKSSTTFAQNVLSAGASLLKWGGLVFGGLAAGSLWGFDRLAANASGTRRQSMGLGLSTGELQSFRTNFSRLVDPDSFLETVNQILTDPRKSWAASALGVGTGGSTEQTAVDLLKAMRSRARGTDVSMLGMLSQQTGVDVGTDVWRRLHDMGSSEFNGLIAANRRDVSQLGYSDRTGRAFTDFETQLERAKKQIEAVFITGLVPLTPGLSKLSASVAGLIGSLMRSDVVGEGVKRLAGGIDWLGGKIASHEFQSGVEDVLHSIGEVALGFVDFAKNLKDDLPSIQAALHAIAHPVETSRSAMSNWMERTFHPDQFYQFGASKAEVSKFLEGIDRDNNLPSGTMAKLWQQESSSRFNPPDSKKGAQGPFQLMPMLVAAMGANSNGHSFVDSANIAGGYLSELRAHYNGDLRKALAAYNWGPSKVDYAIKRYHDDWLSHTPTETRNYVSSMMGQSGGTRVVIENNTGGSAVVSTSQLGATR